MFTSADGRALGELLKRQHEETKDILIAIDSKFSAIMELIKLRVNLDIQAAQEAERKNLPNDRLPEGPDCPCPKCDSVSVHIPSDEPHIRICKMCEYKWQHREEEVPA